MAILFFLFIKLFWFNPANDRILEDELSHSLGQTEGIAVYNLTQDNFGVDLDYVLKFRSSEMLFEHHQEYRVFTNDQGWEYYANYDYYDWHLNFSTGQVTQSRKLKDGTLLTSSFPSKDLNWTITNETNKIAGYNVQKAICKSHHGYEYGDAIAWFTVDVPIPAGPFQYYGLPGLIVKLEFSNRFEKYTLKTIKFQDVGSFQISEGIQVTKDEIYNPNLIDKKWLKGQKKKIK